MASVTLASSCSAVRAIRAHALRALFDFLKEAGDTDFYEFVQIVCGDGEKLDALEKWVARVRALLPERGD